MTISSDIHDQHGQKWLLPASEISLENLCLQVSSVSHIYKVQHDMGHLQGSERVPYSSKCLSHQFPKGLNSSAKSYVLSFRRNSYV